jgi:hypothetical protein
MLPLYVIFKKGKLLFRQCSFTRPITPVFQKNLIKPKKNPIEKALEIKILDIYKCLIYP